MEASASGGLSICSQRTSLLYSVVWQQAASYTWLRNLLQSHSTDGATYPAHNPGRLAS